MNFSYQSSKRRRLPLKLHLIFWSSGLVLTLCLVLVLFVNILVARSFPHLISQALPPLPVSSCQVSAPVSSIVIQDKLNSSLVTNLWLISLIGLGLVAFLGCTTAYWFVGRALAPLQYVSRAAERTHAQTLNTRLAFNGPDDEIKRLADAFDSMLKRLEQAFETQSRFVGDVSHELRTPLALLRTNLEVAASNKRATLHEVIATQERGVTRLEHLVSDLLFLARCEQPTIVNSEISLEPLIEEVLDEVKPTAEIHQVTLILENTAEVIVRSSDDGSLLTRAFSNLIENAIYYNHVGGKVTVTIDQTPDWAQVTVADTGIGIAPEQLPHIFERFYRTDSSRARNKGGAGLGLAIVSTIIQQYGGSINVNSTPNTGTTFTIRLPLSLTETHDIPKN